MSTDNYKLSKCQRSKQILINSWESKYLETDFKDLIDIEKLKTLGKLEYRNISKLGLLTDSDKAFISENRRKVNNRRAAKKFRESEKCRQISLYSTVETLQKERNSLLQEKKQLMWEIQAYSSACPQPEPIYHMYPYPHYPTGLHF